MAQCFISTYRNHYRWPEPQTTLPIKPEDKSMTVIPNEDIWIGSEISDDKVDSAEIEQQLYLCYLKRLITTYQYSYCKDLVAKFLGEPVDLKTSENQLLESAKKLFEPESRPKIAPPLVGTRRVFGYIRPSRNYTPLTNYQYNIGRTAYKILKEQNKNNRKCCKCEE